MNTEDKSFAIIKKIAEIAQEGKKVSFERDFFGPLSMTIIIDNQHTHIGWTDCSPEQMIDNLYNVLHDGPGLSWE